MNNSIKYVVLSWVTAVGLLGIVLFTAQAGQTNIKSMPETHNQPVLSSIEFSDWIDECIDCRESDYIGSYVSIAVDKDEGTIHASYSSIYSLTDSRFLYYAVRDDSGWHTQTVDSTAPSVYETSIALDSDGYPHIGYAKQTCPGFGPCASSLHYAYLDNTGWHTTTVDNNGDVGSNLELALDSNDLPHITYLDKGNETIKYAHFDSSDWQIDPVAAAGGSIVHTSIDVDRNNFPHVSYIDRSNDDLTYAYLDGSGWHTQTVDSIGSVGWQNSLRLDGNDKPHIGYEDSTNNTLKYATLDNSTWVSETIAANINWEGVRPSLAIDSNELPHVAFASVFDCNMFSCQFNLHYIYFDGAHWEMETLVNSHSAGSFLSLALDAEDYPHIGYFDDTDSDLHHIYGTILTGPDSVAIAGPVMRPNNQPVLFSASVEPISSTTPLTYVWEATDQMPVTQTNGLTDSIAFTWALTGTKTITVTAVNPGGSVFSTHTITITAGNNIYLPTILKP